MSEDLPNDLLALVESLDDDHAPSTENSETDLLSDQQEEAVQKDKGDHG